VLRRGGHGYNGGGGGVGDLGGDFPARQHQLQYVAVVVPAGTRHLTTTSRSFEDITSHIHMLLLLPSVLLNIKRKY